MGLKIPQGARCQMPGCRLTPTHLLSVRMRRQDSGADWAPNSEAYFCTPHATRGAHISLLYEPNHTGFVEVAVSASRRTVTRTTKIVKRGGVPV